MLDSFLKLVLLPLIVSQAAERIAEWLICKWQDKHDKKLSLSALSKHKNTHGDHRGCFSYA
ncbi:TPA: hypothetical protein ACHU7U_001614 [Streptococcus suis]